MGAAGQKQLGSAAKATVASQSTDVTEANIGVEITKEFEPPDSLLFLVGGTVRNVSSADVTNVTVFGSTQALQTSKADYSDVNIRQFYGKQTANNSVFSQSIEYEFGSDGNPNCV